MDSPEKTPTVTGLRPQSQVLETLSTASRFRKLPVSREMPNYCSKGPKKR